jgi:hypothetical protein
MACPRGPLERIVRVARRKLILFASDCESAAAEQTEVIVTEQTTERIGGGTDQARRGASWAGVKLRRKPPDDCDTVRQAPLPAGRKNASGVVVCAADGWRQAQAHQDAELRWERKQTGAKGRVATEPACGAKLRASRSCAGEAGAASRSMLAGQGEVTKPHPASLTTR